MNVYEYVFVAINGARLPLRNYQGQPLFIVNVASECEFTPQYLELQRMWMDYRQSGLIVLGIPCDDFGQCEPGDEEAIAEFCETNYAVTFPMTAKYNLMGVSAHPMFRDIREEYGDNAAPRWNFHKYLFDRQGQLVDNWKSEIAPNDPLVTHQVERNLQSWIL
jgi:glutathione peroxidase